MLIISIIVEGGNESDNLSFPDNYHDEYDYRIIAQRYARLQFELGNLVTSCAQINWWEECMIQN